MRVPNLADCSLVTLVASRAALACTGDWGHPVTRPTLLTQQLPQVPSVQEHVWAQVTQAITPEAAFLRVTPNASFILE